MNVATAGLAGLAGVISIELLHIGELVRHRRPPWRGDVGLLAFILAEVIRILLGTGLAVAAAAANQISGVLGAFAVGVVAPTVLESVGRRIPISDETAQSKMVVTVEHEIDPISGFYENDASRKKA